MEKEKVWRKRKKNELSRTILELSELVAVFADPRDLRTVKAAAKCLKASVSGPPPATSNNCLSNNIEAYVLPEPLVPKQQQLTYNSQNRRKIDQIIHI